MQYSSCQLSTLSGEKRIISVGDKIMVSITLKEENGKRRARGGDKLHVRILNTTYDAYAPGYVIDHDNGTYTAEVPAIWPGVSIISIHVAYPRELIRVLYATMRELWLVFYIYPAVKNFKIFVCLIFCIRCARSGAAQDGVLPQHGCQASGGPDTASSPSRMYSTCQ